MTTKNSNTNLHHAYTPLTIRRLYLTFILPLLFIISACGGGGDSADPDTPLPVKVAFAENTMLEKMVPADDGVALWTKVFLPEGGTDNKFPVLVNRSPYLHLRSDNSLKSQAEHFTRRGFAFVIQSSRGTHKSDGEFMPYRDEVEDGSALVDWVAQQPWANDEQLGTVGCSYAGYTAMASAIGNDKIKAVWADGAVADESFSFHGGIVNTQALSWFHLMDEGSWFSEEKHRLATNTLSPQSLDSELLGYKHPLWQSMVANPVPTAEIFATHGINHLWPKLCAATLLTSIGEYTVFDVRKGVMENACPAVKDKHKFVVIPGAHCKPSNMWGDTIDDPLSDTVIQFFENNLLNTEQHIIPTNQYMTSVTDKELTSFSSFSEATEELVFYADFTNAYQPKLSNTPVIQSSSIALEVAPDYQDDCTGTSENIILMSPIFKEDTHLLGAPEFYLWGSSSAIDADFFVNVGVPESDQFLMSAGTRTRYRNGYNQPEFLAPNTPAQMTITGLTEQIITIKAGSQIEVRLSGSLCSYLENPHTGEDLNYQTHRISSTHTFYAGSEYPSRLVLHKVK